MRKLAQITAGAKEDVDTVDSGVHSQTGIVQVAARVSEKLCAQSQPCYARAVGPALRAGSRRGQLQVFDTERVEQASDFVLLPAVEKCIGKLLTLS